jgi:alpha-ribazole phosphatase
MSNMLEKRVITLVRHGKITEAAGLYGSTDIPLSETGRKNLEHALTTIHKHTAINRIISSPLQRCTTVARAFATQHSLPFTIEPGLQEMHFGIWDGIPFDDLGDEWKKLENFWNSPNTVQPPEGESLTHFATRVIDSWDTLINNAGMGHQVIVCHGGVIRIIIAHILQLDWCNPSLFKQLQIGYTSHTRIELGFYEQAQPIIKWIAAPTD